MEGLLRNLLIKNPGRTSDYKKITVGYTGGTSRRRYANEEEKKKISIRGEKKGHAKGNFGKQGESLKPTQPPPEKKRRYFRSSGSRGEGGL